MARFAPIPDPSGSLQPPRRPPPTALATSTPQPEPDPLPRMVTLELPERYSAAQHRAALLRQHASLAEQLRPRRLTDRLAALAAWGAGLARRILEPAWY